jgi:hypothetical protein
MSNHIRKSPIGNQKATGVRGSVGFYSKHVSAYKRVSKFVYFSSQEGGVHLD